MKKDIFFLELRFPFNFTKISKTVGHLVAFLGARTGRGLIIGIIKIISLTGIIEIISKILPEHRRWGQNLQVALCVTDEAFPYMMRS